jgi:cobalamin synthase
MDQQTRIMGKNRKDASNGAFGFVVITLVLLLLFCLLLSFILSFALPEILTIKDK